MNLPCDIFVDDTVGTETLLVANLQSWLAELVAEVAPQATSFAVRLADDDEVRAYNADLRGRDRSTDVLSFVGGATPEGNHVGDVVISMPIARRQADELGHSLECELQELILHGVLHCLGHDHETDDGEMDALEVELRRRWIES